MEKTITAPAQLQVPQPQDDEDSWVNLAPSRDSSSSIAACTVNVGLERLLVDASQSANSLPVSAKDSRHSPKSLQSPNVEFVTNLEAVKFKLKQDMLPPGRNTDWLWDWSSRPEVNPPKEWRLKRPTTAATTTTGGATGTTNTPPNSPIPSPASSETSFPISLRHSKIVKSKLFSVEFFSVLFVTNLVSLLIGAGIGVYISERWHCKVDTY